jgi:hypothetical protein
MMHSSPYPASFSEANHKLHVKFRRLDNATIEDSIQYARIEFWTKHIGDKIEDESDALGWLLHVADRYLFKEVKRISKQCNIAQARNFRSSTDIESQFIYREALGSLAKSNGLRNSPLVMHAMGYALDELAKSENISISAMRQRHARDRMTAGKEITNLFH